MMSRCLIFNLNFSLIQKNRIWRFDRNTDAQKKSAVPVAHQSSVYFESHHWFPNGFTCGAAAPTIINWEHTYNHLHMAHMFVYMEWTYRYFSICSISSISLHMQYASRRGACKYYDIGFAISHVEIFQINIPLICIKENSYLMMRFHSRILKLIVCERPHTTATPLRVLYAGYLAEWSAKGLNHIETSTNNHSHPFSNE